MAKAQIRHNTLKDGRKRWYPVMDLGRDENGKRITDTWPGGPWDTEREAIIAGHELEKKYSNDATWLAEQEGKKLVRDVADTWITVAIEGRLEELGELTVKEYKARMRNWILPYLGTAHLGKELPPTKAVCLGKKRIMDVTKNDIEDWFIKLKPLSPAYRGAIISVASAFFKWAHGKGYILSNPVALADRGNPTQAKRKAAEEELEMSRADQIWDQETLPPLIEAAIGDDAEALVILGGLGGLRPGEVEGTKVDEVDYVKSEVWVRRANRTAKHTKGGGSRRVKLTAETMQLLAALIERQEVAAKAKGLPVPVWISPILQRQAARNLEALCRKAGVKVLHPHCLRHSYASILLSENTPITTVAKLLGHANSGITERFYAHAIDRDTDAAPLKLSKALKLRQLVDRALNLSPESGDGGGQRLTPMGNDSAA